MQDRRPDDRRRKSRIISAGAVTTHSLTLLSPSIAKYIAVFSRRSFVPFAAVTPNSPSLDIPATEHRESLPGDAVGSLAPPEMNAIEREKNELDQIDQI